MKVRVLSALACMACLAVWPVLAGDGPTCADCHDEVVAAMAGNVHMRVQSFEVMGKTTGCEGCHGDGTRHMEEGDPALIRTFAEPGPEDARTCLSCHRDKGLPEWDASTHAAEGLDCFTCHSVHYPTDPLDRCADCHGEVAAQMQLPSHHPVREGKMTCASCHDVHLATEAQLRTHQRVNDLCFVCHQAQEGPFVFEHDPVEEDCRICHDPHGTVANNLLVANEPMLCLQCHEFHFHAGLVSPDGPVDVGGTEYENPIGRYSMNRAFTTKCTTCHPKVHGSDLPSQTTPGMGRGLTR